jgi:hypothetical protein
LQEVNFVAATNFFNFSQRIFASLDVATSDVDFPSTLGQIDRRLFADASVGAGDNDDLAIDPRVLGVFGSPDVKSVDKWDFNDRNGEF